MFMFYHAGHTNIFYIGDRVKRSGQLNGKSANLNHAILRKVFPSARTPKDVPIKDILLVMDVDHLVKPDIFNRMGYASCHANKLVLGSSMYHSQAYWCVLTSSSMQALYAGPEH